METVLATNDPVELAWARAVLAEAGIDHRVFDEQTSVLEGSIGAIPRRLVVPVEVASRARWLLAAARRALDGRREADDGDHG